MSFLLTDCCIQMKDWMIWLALYLKNKLNLAFHSHNSWHRVYLSVCLFFICFQQPETHPVTFRYSDALGCSCSNIEITFCQLFVHPHNWQYSSSSQQIIPVLSNFTVHFQTFRTSISRLTSVLLLAIIFDTTPTNKSHKPHLHLYSAYDSRYDRSEFLTLERTTWSELFRIVQNCSELFRIVQNISP